MIRRSLLLLAFLILVLTFVPSCGSSDDDVLGFRTTGTIEGLVYDVAVGEPLANATVTIASMPFETDTTGTGEIIIKTTSDADGRFLRPDIANGAVKIMVRKDGYRTPDPQYWALTPGGGGAFRFEMAPGEDPVDDFTGDEQGGWGAGDNTDLVGRPPSGADK